MVTIVTHCSAEFCTGLGVKRKIGSDGDDDGDDERDCHGDADGDDGNRGDNDDDDDDGDLNLRRAVHLGQGSSGSCGGAKKAKVAKVLQPGHSINIHFAMRRRRKKTIMMMRILMTMHGYLASPKANPNNGSMGERHRGFAI